jgi:UDP-N-acetylmuramate dehydrogenase
MTSPCELVPLEIEQNAILRPLTSWQVGGIADFLVKPRNVEELVTAAKWASSHHLPISILGGGTNVLVSDRGVRGAVIALGQMSSLRATEQESAVGRRLVLECLAGTPKSELLKVFLKYRLAPALFLAGLPGDVGGGVVMNAGVGESLTPKEFCEIVDWIEVLRPNGSVERILGTALKWGYRHCEGWQPGIILRVGLSWALEPKEDILQKVREANQLRFSKQPLELPSCGSVFVNPPGEKAGRLIEECGLKGLQIGGAQVSPKHANFIVNAGGASADDIHAVIQNVQQTVKAKTGIHLQTEVVYLGEWS